MIPGFGNKLQAISTAVAVYDRLQLVASAVHHDLVPAAGSIFPRIP